MYVFIFHLLDETMTIIDDAARAPRAAILIIDACCVSGKTLRAQNMISIIFKAAGNADDGYSMPLMPKRALFAINNTHTEAARAKRESGSEACGSVRKSVIH